MDETEGEEIELYMFKQAINLTASNGGFRHLDLYLAFLCPIRDQFLCQRYYSKEDITFYCEPFFLSLVFFSYNNSGFWNSAAFLVLLMSETALQQQRVMGSLCSKESQSVGCSWAEFGCPSSRISDFFTSTVGRQNQPNHPSADTI